MFERKLWTGPLCCLLAAAAGTGLIFVTGCPTAGGGGGGGEPQCAAEGEDCNADADCCEGLVCGDDGTCQEEEPACAQAGEACEADADCCEGLVCGDDNTCQEPAPECAEAGEACEADADCCEGLICGDDNTCQEPAPECAEAGEACTEDADCCEGLVCGDDDTCVDMIADVTARFETSLHNQRTGKQTFYEGTEDEPGFVQLTEIAYEELSCANCHAPTLADGTEVDAETYMPSCADCHIDPANPTGEVAESICLACHGRQQAERGLAANPDYPLNESFSDVHRDRGMVCTNCHGETQMHGTGMEYASLLDADAPKPACEDCHVEGGSAPEPPMSVTEHTLHLSNIDCAACHVQSVIACYDCHFETEVEQDFKRFYGPPPRAGFVMLVNRTDRDKISTATFQSLTYDGDAFVVIAPFYSHTVAAEGARICGDCHNNEKAIEWLDTGSMTVATFEDGTLTGPSGVIPVPPDWKESMIFDHVVYTADDLSPTDPPFQPDLWEELVPAEELRQMLPEYCTPLTQDQMESLGPQ